MHGIESRVSGLEHPDTLTIAGNLAICLQGQGLDEKAEQILREVHAVELRLLGPQIDNQHPDTLSTASNLATSLGNQGKHAQCKQINCEVHAMCVRVLGPEHPDTLTTAGNLARSLDGLGKHEKAEQEMHGIEMRVLGPEHPNTLRVRSGLQTISLCVSITKRSMPRRSRCFVSCMALECECWDRSIRTRPKVRTT